MRAVRWAGRRAAPTCVTSTGAAGVGQHEGEALGGIVRIERQVGAAGLEDAEERDQHVERALDAEAHDGLGADAEPTQMMRELVGAASSSP